jgi:hypothetical protein
MTLNASQPPIFDFCELQKKEDLDTSHNKKIECSYTILEKFPESEASTGFRDGISPIYLPK